MSSSLIVRIDRHGNVVAQINNGGNVAMSFPVDGWQVFVEQADGTVEGVIVASGIDPAPLPADPGCCECGYAEDHDPGCLAIS